MINQFFFYKVALLVTSLCLFGFCSPKNPRTNNFHLSTDGKKIDSCSIAKPFQNCKVIESLVKPDYSGELINYWGMDKSKIDFKHFYKNGKLVKSIFYYENGQIQEEYTFKCGALHGMQKYYYNNGTLEKIIPFSYGYRQGTGKMFDENGVLRQRVTFIADSIIGEP